MSIPANLYSIASAASERLLFSLGIGTVLAVIVWLLLRVFPRKDSRTSFAVWFATLLITAVLPISSLYLGSHGEGAGSPAAVITVSASLAVYIFLGWAVIACLGLARVAVALWQVHRLRSGSTGLDVQMLHPELRELVEEFRRSRSVKLLVSQRLEVPTAIGFFKPAIVLPEWLFKEIPAEELKYILLHELAHLRRRDDWTNLAQQIVKALLFFVPSVWWIERRLALDREMACDDAVLAQAGSPHGYAQCLAHVAERSFLRRQLALAQAAVSKLRQLTVRVTRILDPNRQQPTRMWKPAVPAVVFVAGLCTLTASQSPSLIGFADPATPFAVQLRAGEGEVQGPAVAKLVPAQSAELKSDAAPRLVVTKAPESGEGSKVRMWNASLRVDNGVQKRPHRNKRAVRKLSNLSAANAAPSEPVLPAGLQPSQAAPEYVTVRQEFVMVVAQQGDAGTQSWQMHVVQISVTQSKPQKQLPKKI